MRKKTEGVLLNNHYKYFYTQHFMLDESHYVGKFILDIGCGPRGSLEWATMASRRVGVDPLAKEYRRIGTIHHKMEYIDAPAESIPIGDGKCDIVTSFNSLDHVTNIQEVISEIKRVTRPGGFFLLLVEVNHTPTSCEPHNLNPQEMIDLLTPEFACEQIEVYKRIITIGMYQSIRKSIKFSNPFSTKNGYMSAKFLRL